MIAEKSPCAWGQHGLRENRSAGGILADRAPVCKLHGLRLVYGFPKGCPLGFANPLERILQIQGRGWGQLAKPTANDHRGGLVLLHIADVCGACVDRLLPNRHLHYLRERAQRYE